MTAQLEPGNWRTSSRSVNGSACVEIGCISSAATVRDTKNREAGYFTANPSQWQSFLNAVKADRFH